MKICIAQTELLKGKGQKNIQNQFEKKANNVKYTSCDLKHN
jgi:hypothetical protein